MLPQTREFANAILSHFGAASVPAPARPQILWISRNDSGTRVVPFEAEMERWVRATYRGAVGFRSAVLAHLPFSEQLRLARGSNILVGANGAGLWHALFMADEGVVVEVQWRRDQKTTAASGGGVPEQFRNIARSVGKVHLAVQASSGPVGYDAGRRAARVEVTEADLRRALRAAIDVAGGFGRGAGLVEADEGMLLSTE